MRSFLRSFAIASVILIAGCAGSGGGTVPVSGEARTTTVEFHIVLPSSSGISPKYISASTRSASIAVTPSGGNAGPPTVVNCTSSCNAQVLAPIGSDTFAVKLFDAQGAGGNLLSTGTVTQTIVVDQANTVSVTFNGVVASMSVLLSPSTVNSGTAATAAVTVNALDAGGNTIVSPGNYVDANGNPLTITLSDSDGSGATRLSVSSVIGPTSGITLSYNGATISSPTITASATGLISRQAILTVNVARNAFVYAVNNTSNNLSAYTIGATGALTQVASSPFGGGHLPIDVALVGKFVYMTNPPDNDVAAYTVDLTTGYMTPVVGSPFPTSRGPIGVAVTSRFAYVVGFDPSTNIGMVSAYTIDYFSGALMPVSGSPFAAGVSSTEVVIDPYFQKFAYVVNSDLVGTISAYTINSTTGALTPMAGSPFAAGRSPSGVAIDRQSKFVYVTATDSLGFRGSVFAYTINSASGALTPVAGSPFAAGFSPHGVAVDPSGKFAYVVNSGNLSNNISAYTIDATTGALTPVPGSPYAATYFAGSSPERVAIDPSGKYAYVTNSIATGNIFAYAINATTGALTPLAGSPFAAGSSPMGIAATLPGPFAQ